MNTYAQVSHWTGLDGEWSSHDLDKHHSILITQLESLLPHGSGIDYDWNFTVQQNGLINCHNSYHAMAESGMYCHVYDFSIKIKPTLNNPDFMVKNVGIPFSFEYISFSFKGQKEYTCCGYGLKDYLIDTVPMDIN